MLNIPMSTYLPMPPYLPVINMNYGEKKSGSKKCKTCGALLVLSKAKNGICKCEWCRSENYV